MTRHAGALNFKLPAEFVAAHRNMLEAWDWRRRPVMPLSEVLPEIEDVATVALEIARGLRGGIIVRAKGAGANKLRKYADTLPAQPKPSPEEVAAVLARRNKPKVEQE